MFRYFRIIHSRLQIQSFASLISIVFLILSHFSFGQNSTHLEDILARLDISDTSSFDQDASPTEVKEILGTYIQVERDSLGYLIYKPCQGRTPRIEVSQDSIIVFGQIDFPARLEKTKLNEKKGSIRMKAENNGIYWSFTWKQVDTDQGLVLVDWKWSAGGSFSRKERAVYMNESKAKLIRRVENQCEGENATELQFLPIEFE